jgi:hypothetical protein
MTMAASARSAAAACRPATGQVKAVVQLLHGHGNCIQV